MKRCELPKKLKNIYWTKAIVSAQSYSFENPRTILEKIEEILLIVLKEIVCLTLIGL